MLGQTVPPLEIIVVDDGSTDDSERSLAPYLHEITLIRKENGGGASAFNAGLRTASGDFVAVLDADDAYQPDRIEAFGELGAARPDLDLLATDAYLEVGGEIVGRFSSGTPFAHDDQREGIFDRCFMLNPALRRGRVLAIGGEDESFRIAYDWDCYLRLILAGSRAGFVDRPLYRYRLTSTSLTGNRPAALRERVVVLEKATANIHVRPEERLPLQRALVAKRTSALLAEAEAALRRGDPDARRRSFAVATGRHFGLRTRDEGACRCRRPPLGRSSPRGEGEARGSVTAVEERASVTAWVAPPARGQVAPVATPSFSVVIAAYQAADTVAEAIESALSQTLPPLEAIVCDDGSTDDTAEAVAPYLSEITFLRKENGGEGSAKNTAAKAASGDFVVILDADDVFLPVRLERLGELAGQRPDLDILTTDADLEIDGEFVRRCYTDSFRFEVDDQRRGILHENFIFGHAAVRRERLLAAGGFDEVIRWTTDWDCWLRLILDGSRAGLVAEPLSRYRLNSGGLSSQREAHLSGRLQTLDKAARRTGPEPGGACGRARLDRAQRAGAASRSGSCGPARASPRRTTQRAGGHRGRGHGLTTRVKALAAAVAPGAARRRAARAPRETTAGIMLPPEDPT